MNLFSIKITNANQIDEEIIYHLISALRNNGQIISSFDVVFCKNTNMYETYVYSPESNSLEVKWNNTYVNKWRDEILSNKSKITINNINQVGGNSIENLFDCSHLILSYNIFDDTSPLFSGDDFKNIPLYLLPKTFDDGYYDILSWFDSYKNIYELEESFLSCHDVIKNELYNLKSKLNKRGREICKHIEKLSRIPTYYYVSHYTYRTSIHKEINRHIGTTKKSKTKLLIDNDFYQLINEKERLVSNITPNMLDKVRKFCSLNG